MVSTLVFGLVLGGTYALVAIGLTLQYGIARIMNLAYGEFIIAASFAALVLFTGLGLNPIIALVLVAPASFAVSYLVYVVMMRPLVRRARDRAGLEINSILATFGLLFVIQGILLVFFGGNFNGYAFLDIGVPFVGVTIAANRLLAFVLAVGLGIALYLTMTRTRWGTAMRAVSSRPDLGPLVGVDVDRMARLAFALGGALAASGGVVVSMYQTFTAASGVVFTMKALIVVIMGGVGNVMGALVAGLLLGLAETFVAAYVDPGLTIAATYTLFLGVLLWRPAGLFGRASG